MAAAVRAALKLVAAADDQRDKLHELVALLDDGLEKQLKIVPSGTPIQPIVLGSDERALKIAARLQQQGFDIRAIRPPTVPEGTARLRISVTLHADAGAIDRLVEALASGLPVAGYPVPGPLDIVTVPGVGAIDEDLRIACLTAVSGDPAACRRHAGKISLHIRHENRHADARKLLGHRLQRDRLAGAGRAGDDAMAVGAMEQQALGLALIGLAQEKAENGVGHEGSPLNSSPSSSAVARRPEPPPSSELTPALAPPTTDS